MPPASLSTFAVMIPGPTTERKISSPSSAPAARSARPPRLGSSARARSPVELRGHVLEDVVDGDDPLHHAVVVDDGRARNLYFAKSSAAAFLSSRVVTEMTRVLIRSASRRSGWTR